MARRRNSRKAFDQLNDQVLACESCPRLIAHCRKVAVEKRAAYRDMPYHGKPVPNFGDPAARVLIVGLAPGAHGANRTGRMFTGDRSGDFLYPILHKAGFASQADSQHASDGLTLKNAVITAAAHCAPPGNKPTTQELKNCAGFLEETIQLLTELRVIVSLGKVAHESILKFYRDRGSVQRLSDFPFSHGAEHHAQAMPVLLCAYHPSQQNTFTGRLTEQMLLDVFKRAGELAC